MASGRFFVSIALFISFSILPSVGSTQTIGLYFDSEGLITESSTSTQPQVVPVFLVLRQASEPILISNWECRVTTSGEGTFLPWTLSGGGLNSLGDGQFCTLPAK